MQIYGIDFTSAPSISKRLPCIGGVLKKCRLEIDTLHEWDSFVDFEALLSAKGKWVMALDFPFGLPRKVAEYFGCDNWCNLAQCIGGMEKQAFFSKIDAYVHKQSQGQKRPLRKCDIIHLSSGTNEADYIVSRALSSLDIRLRGMVYEGISRLYENNVTIPAICNGNPEHIAIEAYPALYPHALFGKKIPYKDRHNTRKIRKEILYHLCKDTSHLSIVISDYIARRAIDDNHGDVLDSLICAATAAHYWQNRKAMSSQFDPLEGCIILPPPFMPNFLV